MEEQGAFGGLDPNHRACKTRKAGTDRITIAPAIRIDADQDGRFQSQSAYGGKQKRGGLQHVAVVCATDVCGGPARQTAKGLGIVDEVEGFANLLGQLSRLFRRVRLVLDRLFRDACDRVGDHRASLDTIGQRSYPMGGTRACREPQATATKRPWQRSRLVPVAGQAAARPTIGLRAPVRGFFQRRLHGIRTIESEVQSRPRRHRDRHNTFDGGIGIVQPKIVLDPGHHTRRGDDFIVQFQHHARLNPAEGHNHVLPVRVFRPAGDGVVCGFVERIIRHGQDGSVG